MADSPNMRDLLWLAKLPCAPKWLLKAASVVRRTLSPLADLSSRCSALQSYPSSGASQKPSLPLSWLPPTLRTGKLPTIPLSPSPDSFLASLCCIVPSASPSRRPAIHLNPLSSASLPRHANSGYVAWVTEAFGPFFGFLEGLFSWISGVTDNAIYPVMFLTYIDAAWPEANLMEYKK